MGLRGVQSDMCAPLRYCQPASIPSALLLRAAAGGEAEGVGAALCAGAAAARVLAQRHQLAAEHAQALRAGKCCQGHSHWQRPRLRWRPGVLSGRTVYSSWLTVQHKVIVSAYHVDAMLTAFWLYPRPRPEGCPRSQC